jgi:hypothetical protein
MLRSIFKCCITCMFRAYVFKCFRCFIRILQIFHLDVAKKDMDVAYASMAIHACFKCFIYFSDVCFKCFI